MISAFMLDASIPFAWAIPCAEGPASETVLKLVESGKVAVMPELVS